MMISFASCHRPCRMYQRGESGIIRYRKTSTIVGIEIAMYSCDHVLKNIDSDGNRIRPIDQNSSNTIDVIIFGWPPVMSARIIWPDVYIRAHVIAEKQRNITCSSYVLTRPAELPHTICVSMPVSITLRGLIL